jgi:outer membrane cobalamin receptor
VTVITREDIERRRAQTVEEVLRDVPGVNVQSSGGFPGVFTQVRIRGANPDQSVVLVDGARVNDLFLGGAFDFGLVPLDNVERIEVVRGGASALYGSDAIGGVINIITRKGDGKPRLTVCGEGGSQHTFKEGAQARGTAKGLDFTFSYSRLDSAGFGRALQPQPRPGTTSPRARAKFRGREGSGYLALDLQREHRTSRSFDFLFGYDSLPCPCSCPRRSRPMIRTTTRRAGSTRPRTRSR